MCGIRAKQQLKAVQPDGLRLEIVEVILNLRDDPRPPNSELQRELQRELHGRYRLKIEGWRVFFKVEDQDRVVTVLELRRRNRNTYLNVP